MAMKFGMEVFPSTLEIKLKNNLSFIILKLRITYYWIFLVTPKINLVRNYTKHSYLINNNNPKYNKMEMNKIITQTIG